MRMPPVLMPKLPVCSPNPNAVAQMSLLLMTAVPLDAVGGVEFVTTVLLTVLSAEAFIQDKKYITNTNAKNERKSAQLMLANTIARRIILHPY